MPNVATPAQFLGASGPAGGVLAGTYPNPGLAPGSAMQRQAATALAGFALQNATPTILTWTPPNDGAMHRFLIVPFLNITTLETGGALTVNFTDPAGNARAFTIQGGGAAAGLLGWGNGFTNWITLPCAPGQPVSLVQSSALTAGAATLWAELWGS